MGDDSDFYVIIGGGRMGMAMAQGWVQSGIAAAQIVIIEPDASRAAHIALQHFLVFGDVSAIPTTLHPRVTLLAVKPQSLSELGPHLSAFLAARPAHMLISILAGTTLPQLTALAPNASVIRAMPNTPALIGQGITACIAAPGCSESARALATSLLEAVGEAVWLEEEAQMDAATALSGSGPAYAYYFLECLIEAGIAQGLPEDTARRLALVTLRGAGILATSATESLSELRRNVTSPGGTTEAALQVLMDPKRGFAPLIHATLAAAAARAKTLAQG